MATKRGQQDGPKPADAAQGVAPVSPQGQTQTPQAPVAGEGLPDLTIGAYEAIVKANTDLSAKLAEALDTVAELTAKLAEAQGREKEALAVIDLLNATNAQQTQRLNKAVAVDGAAVEEAADLSSTISIADAAQCAGVRVDQVFDFKLYDDALVVVTRSGKKIRVVF